MCIYIYLYKGGLYNYKNYNFFCFIFYFELELDLIFALRLINLFEYQYVSFIEVKRGIYDDYVVLKYSGYR